MAINRSRRHLIAGSAIGALLIGGTLAGCAPNSLALHAATTATAVPAVATGGGNAQGQPISVAPSGAGVASAPAIGIARSVGDAPSTPASVTTHGIAVVGDGEVQARPDEAIVTVGVQTRSSTAQEAQSGNNTTMQAVVAAVKALNIPAKDIQTTGVSLYPVVEEQNTVSGYNAMNEVTVTVENIDQVGNVLDAAVKAGANTAGNIRFTFKNSTELRNKALQAAAADARSKADALAAALGLKISGIQSVSEGQVNVPLVAMPAAARAAGSSASVPVEPGQQTISAQVTVVFGY